MPRQVPKTKYKDVKSINISWKEFSKGLNKLVSPAKIRDNELSIADNIILIDEGSPVKRWGTDYYGNDSGGTLTQALQPYYSSDGNNKLLKIEDGLAKVFNYSTENWDAVYGGSFSSGLATNGVVAFDKLYLGNGTDPLTKFDGTTLTVFSEISAPAAASLVLGGSLASGQHQYSYRISAVNAVGETLATDSVTIDSDVPREDWNVNPASINEGNSVQVSWEKSTGATGYNIYGVIGGSETYLHHVDGEFTNSWADYGTSEPSAVFTVPSGNGTGGPKGKYMIEFKTSLLIGGDPDNPSRVYYSAGVDKIDSFLISDGGGYIDVSKNSDDGVIKGLASFQNKAIVFKERSVWQIDFTSSAIPSLQNIVKGIGCISHNSIANVENDVFFLGRKIGGGPALYTLGNEPNFLGVLRTNEISTRVRPVLEALGASDLEEANSVYFDGKYILFFTDGSSAYNNAAIVYDRERLAYTEWNSIYSTFSTVFYDADNEEHLLFVDGSDNRVSKLSDSYTTDKSNAIIWKIKTKEEDLKKPFLYKKFKWVNIRLRSVQGSTTLSLITDSQTAAFQSSINAVSVNTVFKTGKFRTQKFRVSQDAGTSSPETIVVRRIPIAREGSDAIARSIAIQLYGEGSQSQAALLDVDIEARPKSDRFYPREEVIS